MHRHAMLAFASRLCLTCTTFHSSCLLDCAAAQLQHEMHAIPLTIKLVITYVHAISDCVTVLCRTRADLGNSLCQKALSV